MRGYTFGQCAFETPTGRIEPDSEVHFALLLFLAAAGPEGAAREEVIGTVWPSATPGVAGHRLRQALYRLRGLGVPARSHGGRVHLGRESIECDLRALLDRRLRRDDVIRLGGLPFLPGYQPQLGHTFADWTERLRARVSAELRGLLSEELSAARSRGFHRDVGPLARALLTIDPLNESATLALAESMAMEGSKVQAIRLLETYEADVGAVNPELRVPARLLRKRVSAPFGDSLHTPPEQLPLVGRESEVEHLVSLFKAPSRHHWKLAVLVGEGGIGKTRLAAHFLRYAAIEGSNVATYAASDGDSLTPLSAVTSIARTLLGLPGALGCEQSHLQYVQRLATPDGTTSLPSNGIGADVAYAHLASALADVVAAVTHEAPVTLFIDNGHRLHPTFWRVLFDVVERAGTTRLIVLVAARDTPPALARLASASSVVTSTSLVLTVLSESESVSLLHAWSAANDVQLPEHATARCLRTAQGNPFFLIETAAHLAADGDPTSPPRPLRELIELQYAGLSRVGQRVVLATALLDKYSTLERVTAVLDLPMADLMSALEEVESSRLLTINGIVLRCKHDIIAEVVRSKSLRSLSALLRTRIALVLANEASETNALSTLADCITHFKEAGDSAGAYRVAMQAGSRLLSLGLAADADVAFREAGSLASSYQQELAALNGRTDAARASADWVGVRECLTIRTRKLGVMPLVGAELHEHTLLSAEAGMLLFTLDVSYDRLLSIAHDALASTDIRLRAACLAAMTADNNYDGGVIAQAHQSCDELRIAHPSHPGLLLLELIYHNALGDMNRALALADEYSTTILADPKQRGELRARRRAAHVLMRLGQHERARQLLNELLEESTRLRLPMHDVAILDMLMWSHFETCEVREATALAQRISALANHDDTPFLQTARFVSAAFCAWINQDVDAAQKYASVDIRSWRRDTRAARNGLLGATLALKCVLDPAMISDEELQRAVDLHLAHREIGGTDALTAVLLTALERCGRREDARTLRTEYLTTYRRTFAPPMLKALLPT